MKKISNSLSSNKTQICDFTKGPSSDTPLTPHHGGPILNMDVLNNIVVTASTDHGARVYNLGTGKQIRELYNKQYGHTEWVTCVKILKDGRILTGGMDSKICVWDAKSVKCMDLFEHQGSISKIMTDNYDNNETIFVSSSYDTTLRVYSTANCDNLAVLKGIHRKPVTEFNFAQSLLVSADRDGGVCFWDLNSEKCVLSKQLHQGQISNVVFHSDGINSNLILTSGVNDGVVNCFDMKSSEKVFSKRLHSGAINLLKSASMSNLVFTGSADKTIKVLDVLNGFSEINSMKSTDAVFCGDLLESSFLVAGCGDGSILGYDLNKFDCVWGYGVEETGGVRCVHIEKAKNRIITGGDSGKGLEILFE